MDNRKTTIKELAKHANVSISTVSKALKDSPEISETTKKKIQKLAKIHQYTPNNLAVSFKSGKSKLIGVILPSLSKMLFSNILYGIEQKAKENAYKIIVSFSDDSNKTEKEITNQLFKSSIDGLIIIPCEETIKKNDFLHLNKIAENGIPTLLLSQENTGLATNTAKLENGSNPNFAKAYAHFQKSASIGDVSIWLKQFQEFFNNKILFPFSAPSPFEGNLPEDGALKKITVEEPKNLSPLRKKISFHKKREMSLSKFIKTSLIYPGAEQNEINIGKLASQSIMNALTTNIKPFLNQIN